MVRTAKNEITRELDSYLKKRKKSTTRFSIRNINITGKESNNEKNNKKEINQDEEFQEYKKPRKSFWKKLFSRGEELVEEDPLREDLTPEEMERLRAMEEKLEKIDEVEEENPYLEEELEEAKEGIISKIIRLIRIGRRREEVISADMIDEEYVEEIIPQIDEDVREILKIVHKWLEKLPPSTKQEFKRSNDFQKYKEILKKYDLIKEKKK